MGWRTLLDDGRRQVLSSGLIGAWLLGAAFETLFVLSLFGLDSFDPILWLMLFVSRVVKPLLWIVAALGAVFPPLTNLTMETPEKWQIIPYGVSTTLVAGALLWQIRVREPRGDVGW